MAEIIDMTKKNNMDDMDNMDNMANIENNENTEEMNTMGNKISEKKISVERFAKGIENIINLKGDEKNKEEALEKYIEAHILSDKYVSYGNKVDIIHRIITSSCYTVMGDGDNAVRVFKQNSPAKHLMFNLSMIDCYTDIDITFTESVNEYDMLTQYGASIMLMNKMPERELAEFAMLMSMEMDDVYENERSAVGMVEGIKLGVQRVVNAVLDGILEVVENNPEGVAELIGNIVNSGDNENSEK